MNKLYNETDVENIAEAIREPLGSSTTYKISEMASGINSLADTLRSYIPHTQASGNPLNINNVIPLKPKVLDVVGDTKQETTSGKNLLKGDLTHESYGLTIIVKNGDYTINGTLTKGYYNLTSKITFDEPLPIGTYTISAYNFSSIIGRPVLRLFDEDNNEKNYYMSYSGSKVTFTTTKVFVAYSIIPDNATTGTIFNNVKIQFQLESGSETTNYEPYTGGIASPNPDYPQPIRNVKSTNGVLELEISDGTNSKVVPFNIGTTEFCKLPNGTADKLWVNLRTGEYGKTQNVGKVVLDGSENWRLSTTKVITQVFQLLKSVTGIRGNSICLCNYYIYNASGDTEKIATGVNGEIYIAINKTTASTVEDFKSWLSTHNTEVQYELATPVTTTLGTLSKENLAKLAMYEGVNNLELSGYDGNGAEPIIEIDYYGGTQNG